MVRWLSILCGVRSRTAAMQADNHREWRCDKGILAHLARTNLLDIDLLLEDVSDESSYLAQLEAFGFRFIFRDDLAGTPHRQLTLAEPNTNLHVWNPDAIEPQRHEIFLQ